MIKIQASKPTEILAIANQERNIDESESLTVKTSTESKTFLFLFDRDPFFQHLFLSIEHGSRVGMVLAGRCLVVPQWLNLFDVLKELGTGVSLIDTAKSDSGRRSVWNKLM